MSRAGERPQYYTLGDDYGRPLTAQQVRILQLVAEGYTWRAIGRRLCIEQATVKNHVTEIFGRLGAVSGPHAVGLALRLRLITYPQPRVMAEVEE